MISNYLPIHNAIQILVAMNTIFGASILFYISIGILRFKKECILIPKEIPEFYISPVNSTSCRIIVSISFAIGTIFWVLILYTGYKSSLRKNTRTIREIA
jgi:multisubunit Na+/H+ antiporter MnhG subunit